MGLGGRRMLWEGTITSIEPERKTERSTLGSGGGESEEVGTNGSKREHQSLLTVLLQSLDLLDDNDVSRSSLDTESEQRAWGRVVSDGNEGEGRRDGWLS